MQHASSDVQVISIPVRIGILDSCRALVGSYELVSKYVGHNAIWLTLVVTIAG